MKLIAFLFILVIFLLPNKGGGRILNEMLVLLLGTALLIRFSIFTLMRLRAFQPARQMISRAFARLPLGLGFSLLVLGGMSVIVAEVILVRDFVRPADSWLSITLGFLLGIMHSLFRSAGRRSAIHENLVAPDQSLVIAVEPKSTARDPGHP